MEELGHFFDLAMATWVQAREKEKQRERGREGDCLLVGGTAGPYTGHGGRPVDTGSGRRNTLQKDIWYAGFTPKT